MSNSGSSPVERNLHEMLRDAPMMNESNNAVHSGTAPPTPQRDGYNYQHPNSLPLNNTAGIYVFFIFLLTCLS